MEEKEGMSLGEIFKIMFSEKWILLIVTLLVTILGTLALQLYSGAKSEYVVDFKLKMPGYSMADSYYYPDGEPFYYSTLVNEKTLEDVKASNPAFNDIDAKALANNGGISIKLELPDADYVSVIDGTFILTASARYFASSDEAKEFLRAVANYPCTYLATMQMKYDSNLILFDGADDYLQQIGYVQSQMNEIRSKLSSLISSYGANLIVEDGKNLNSYLREVNAYANSYEYANLKQEYTGEIIINDKGEGVSNGEHVFRLLKQENIDNYKIQQGELKRELENAEYVLAQMRVNTDTQSNIVAIQQQAQKVTEIRDDKAVVDAILASVDAGRTVVDTDGVFKARIDGVKAKLTEFTETLQRIEPIIYSKSSNANFMKSNIITATGGISVVKSVIISVVVAIVLAAVIAFVVGFVKRKKRGNAAKAAVAVSDAPVFAEAATEIAPAEDKEGEKPDEKKE